MKQKLLAGLGILLIAWGLMPVNAEQGDTITISGDITAEFGEPHEMGTAWGQAWEGYDNDTMILHPHMPRAAFPLVCTHELKHLNGVRHENMTIIEYLGLDIDPRCLS